MNQESLATPRERLAGECQLAGVVQLNLFDLVKSL